MRYRRVGRSGLVVSEYGFGAATFGGRGDFFGAWGTTDVDAARELIDQCLDAGVNLFDTADVYSDGASEEVLGAALRGRRDRVVISTEAALPTGDGPGDYGTSRRRLVHAVESALRRLGTDRIDLFQLHAYDASTPMEEVVDVLDELVRSGKILYTGVSNFSGWQLMKMLSTADERRAARPVAHQVYYSLIGRDYEWELMPLAVEEGVGAIVWSPLGWGRMTGRVRRGVPLPSSSRLHATASAGPPVDDERLYRVVDALDRVAHDTAKTVAQVALNWLSDRHSVSSVIIGARNREQLNENLGAAGWSLSAPHRELLDSVSDADAPYPYFPYYRQDGFARLNPPLYPTAGSNHFAVVDGHSVRPSPRA
ncbi:aldo/keto reductase [Rhodococcus sp. NPDC057297]|uniref:aldo/keto reductase n=1 Tax=Rhodococcus sp. NPDC057297 TaxID=3346090 RepID=UPI00363BD86D